MPIIKKVNNHRLSKEPTMDEISIPNISYLEGLCYSNNMKKSAEPSDPPEGTAIMWLSDGTGEGDAGDVLIKITINSITKTTTLVDFSEI